ncbi:hypothetical protein LTR37_010353 [Vermiconidia calcicola]|uniref:Uncharacterized protein n=1 Tax=Vermiconidia calcicola TaxID=1690605 RepID=A0ACC3N599_9PEZI|nr:hypothetical protein LTR37_010353 [Vermiconidia calcicola]
MPPPQRGYPPQSGYRHVPPQSHGGYPPSLMTSAPGYPEGYPNQALVHMPQQDAFGPQSNPFSPMSTGSNTSYFATEPHAPPMQHHHRPPGPPRPQSFIAPSSHYGSEMMSPYGHPAMPQYPGYAMPGMPGYPPVPAWYPPPPSTHSSPPPQQDDKKSEELESLKALIQKHEEARVAREREMIAKAEADAAAAAEKKAKEEEEKKRKQEIADVTQQIKEETEKKAAEAAKKAKEDAEAAAKKAKEEHEKKLKEAQEAKANAEKKQKELEAETEKLKPAPDIGKAPIKFKDAVNRKFSFPYHLCKTWKGMEGLIRQAFLHVDVIGEHVHQGHYDLTGPDGEIILPQVWETMIQPDWEVTMHMWPMPEKEEKEDKLAADVAALADPFSSFGLGGLGDLGIMDPGQKKPKKGGSKKKKAADADIISVPPPPPGMIPPPPGFPPGILPDPIGMAKMFPEEMKKDKSKSKSKSKGGKDVPAFAAWFAGGRSAAPSKKDDEKFDLVRHKSAHSAHNGDQASCVVM